MSRPCTVCRHDQRQAIDQALVQGETARSVSALFGASRDAISRHNASHVPRVLHQLVQQVAAETAREATLRDQVRRLQMQTETVIEKAIEQEDWRLELTAIGQQRANIELSVEAFRAEELATRIAQLELRLQANARTVVRPREGAWRR